MPTKTKTAKPIVHEKFLAMGVEMVEVDLLVPYVNNPRQHSPEQIDQLCRSIEMFGWTMPIVCHEGNGILAGHGRILAAKKMGITEAPVIWARGWPEAKQRAYILADNKLALNATWDTQLLSGELAELAEAEFPLDVVGFSDDDLKRLDDDLTKDKFHESTGSTDEHERSSGSNGGGDGARDPRNPDFVPFMVPMSVAHRDFCFGAVNKAKKDFGLDNKSGEALWQICKSYMERT